MGTTSVGYSIVIDFRSWLSANWQGCMRSSSQLSRVEGKDGFGFLSKSNNSGKTKGTFYFFLGGLKQIQGSGIFSCFAAKSVRRDVWYLLVRARFWLRKVRKKEKREKREKSKSQKVEKQWFLQSSHFLPSFFARKIEK